MCHTLKIQARHKMRLSNIFQTRFGWRFGDQKSMAQAGALDLARDNIIRVLGLAGPNFIEVLDRLGP